MIILILDTDSVFSTVIEDQVDHVRAYFGMRKIKLGRVAGEKNPRPLLNDKFVFHIGMLDQVILPLGCEKQHRLGWLDKVCMKKANRYIELYPQDNQDTQDAQDKVSLTGKTAR